MDILIFSLIPAILLTITHPILNLLPDIFDKSKKSSRFWISFFAGVSISYVFLHLLPELEAHNQTIGRYINGSLIQRRFIFLAALSGFSFFFVLEITALRARVREDKKSNPQVLVHVPASELSETTNGFIFFTHITTSSIYCFIISYLLPSRVEEFGKVEVWLYWIAVEAHFFVNDMAMKDHFSARFRNYGCYILALATIAGWFTGYFGEIPEFIIPILVGFLSGGSILNIIKEELPDAKGSSNVSAFLFGVLLYSLILMFIS